MRTNDEVAALLEEYADLLAITGGDAFRIRSYEKAARSIAGYPDDLATLDAGALGRMRHTSGDVDMLTISEHPGALTQAFTGLPHVERVVASGDTKTSIRTTLGLQVDLRVVPPSSWGAALQYFTGSRAHNIRIREIAVRKKLKLSEYGLFDVETGDSIASLTEEEVYERLGLPWIPPPLREDAGEIEAA